MDDPAPPLPPGRHLLLPGRGRTWVWDQPGPPGAPTVVLLHGWTSTAALNWHRCFAPLGEHFRVVALDHRGHGRGIRSWRPFRLEDCADDVAALAALLGTGPVVAVGYSMGGPVAQLLWRRHRRAVRGLVLCATAASFVGRSPYRDPVAALGFAGSLVVGAVPDAWRRRVAAELVRRRNPAGGVANWVLDEWRAHDPAALLQAGITLRHYDASPWIGGIDVPTVVVVTGRDATVAPQRQLAMAAAIPGATVVTLDADHRACVDSPAYNPALVEACRIAAQGVLPGAGSAAGASG